MATTIGMGVSKKTKKEDSKKINELKAKISELEEKNKKLEEEKEVLKTKVLNLEGSSEK